MNSYKLIDILELRYDIDNVTTLIDNTLLCLKINNLCMYTNYLG